MSAFPFPRAYRRPACGAVAALGLGLGLWSQAPVPAATSNTAGWQFSAQLSQGFDSNVTFAFQHPESDSTTSLNLTLGRRWAGPRYSFIATYTPEAYNFAAHPKLDYIAQSYKQDLRYSLGQHTQLDWEATAQRYPQRGGVPGSGAMNLPTTINASQALGAQMLFTAANTNLGLTHQYSARSSWSLSAVGDWQSFQPDTSLTSSALLSPNGAALVQPASVSHSAGGSAGWTYELSPARSFGLTASDNEMWFTVPRQRLRYDTVEVTLTQRIGPNLSLSAGAGPSWSTTLHAPAGLSTLPNSRRYAGNASLTAQVDEVSYGVSWQHSEQLGLAPGGLTTDNISFNANWALSRSFRTGASVGRSGGTYMGTGSKPGTLDSVFTAAQIDWTIGGDWSLVANGTYSTQSLPVSVGVAHPLQHLQASLGLTYAMGGAQ